MSSIYHDKPPYKVDASNLDLMSHSDDQMMKSKMVKNGEKMVTGLGFLGWFSGKDEERQRGGAKTERPQGRRGMRAAILRDREAARLIGGEVGRRQQGELSFRDSMKKESTTDWIGRFWFGINFIQTKNVGLNLMCTIRHLDLGW